MVWHTQDGKRGEENMHPIKYSLGCGQLLIINTRTKKGHILIVIDQVQHHLH